MVDRIDSRSRKRVRLWPLAALRIYTGIFFFWHGLGKLRSGKFADSMSDFLTSKLDTAYAFYRPLIDIVFLPSSHLFASLVEWGELLIGLALILGLATRYAAFSGAFLVLNFWFAKGDTFLGGANHDAVWFVIFLVLAFVPAGRVAGLDDSLSDRLPFLR
jgi:thiosulfate dehydrogenase [quinone] large subunit